MGTISSCSIANNQRAIDFATAIKSVRIFRKYIHVNVPYLNRFFLTDESGGAFRDPSPATRKKKEALTLKLQ